MSFNIPITVPGAKQAAADVDAVTASLDKGARAANQARDAAGRFTKAAADSGEASAKAGEKGAAGHDKARKAAEGHGDALTNVIHAVEAYIAVHQLESVIDGYVEVRNKINAVSESQQNLIGLMDETFRIAQETRSSWDELAATYQRVANSARGLGVSQRQVLELTEELAMGMRLSGSNSREASMTMMELTHAFTVGTLTGREFRVMMKDAPALMHELQVASGHTGAEFAEMGKHGKFTAQALIEWFSKAREVIRDKFAQTIPTLAEDLQLLRNAAERFFGEAAVGSGTMTSLANAARYVAEHFEGIAKVAIAVGEALIGLFVIEKITVMVKALTVAVAENPIGAIAVAITVGISLLRQFGDELQTNQKIWANVDDQFVTVGDHLRALWSMIKDLGRAILEFVDGAWHGLTAAFSDGIDTDGIELSLRNVLLLVASFVDAGIGILRFFGETVVTVFGGIPVAITEVFVAMLQVIATAFQDLTNEIIDGINLLIDAVNKLTGVLPKVGGKLQIPSIPHADFSFPNPYEGAAAAIPQKLKEDWESNLRNTNVTKDMVTSFMDELDKRAHEEAARRVQGQGRAGMIDATRGVAEPVPPSEKELKALEKLRNELRAVLEQTNPVIKAQQELMHIEEVLAKAVAAHVKTADGEVFTQERANKAFDDARVKLQDQLQPYEAWTRKQHEAIDAMKSTTEATAAAAAAQAFLNDMKAKGLTPHGEGDTKLTQEQIDAAGLLNEQERRHVELMRAEQQITGAILDPLRQYKTELAAAGDLLAEGTINAEQYGQAIDRIRAAYLAAKPGAKTFADSIEAAWLQMKQEAQDFGATVARMAVDDLGKLNDAIVAAANNGQVSWGQMADAMIQDLERLALKMLEIRLIQAGLSLFGGSAESDAFSAALKSGGIVAPGYATGGSWVVGGVGGIDSQLQVFRATPGERITVTPPGVYPQPPPRTASATSAPAAPAPVIHVHNHYDSSITAAGIVAPAGQTAVLNVLRANAPAIRAALGIR